MSKQRELSQRVHALTDENSWSWRALPKAEEPRGGERCPPAAAWTGQEFTITRDRAGPRTGSQAPRPPPDQLADDASGMRRSSRRRLYGRLHRNDLIGADLPLSRSKWGNF